MKDENVKTNERSIVVPFLVGGVVGAGIALLLAPKSGKELRGRIKDLAVDTKETIASTIEKGKDIYDESKIAITNAVEAGKEAFLKERERHLKAA